MLNKLIKIKEFFHLARGRDVGLDLSTYYKTLSEVNKLTLQTKSDEELKHHSAELIRRARSGESLDSLLVEAFALTREAAQRVLGLRPFDSQMIASIAMHQGKLAEMQAGEGKTLAAVSSAYLNALTGRGVHILTFNDYLAKRDADWMGPLYRFLGLSVSGIDQSTRNRQAAYACDVTYVTAKEAGFDFLRDHLCTRQDQLVQREFGFAIVDEADSIMIDEARIPLVIATSSDTSDQIPSLAAKIIKELDVTHDYKTDEYSRNVHFTEAGIDKLENTLQCGSLYNPHNLQLLTELNLALHAEVLLHQGVDYIVREQKIELVDEFTGRVAENRRWPDGIQAAVEAKEGVPIQPQGIIRGSITLQHFLRLYPKISGMTATAKESAEEFREFYDLKVVIIPPNRPSNRIDQTDFIFTDKKAKTKTLVSEVIRVHQSNRPILVGTASVEESDHIGSELRKAGIAHQVLNARNDRQEADIISNAAIPGAVTISTNMAGRGTDIKLGGNSPTLRDRVADSGGLLVIGTSRFESKRIDKQLKGRAGRQGEPGESRFFISLEDDLVKRYGIKELIPQQYRTLQQDAAIDDPALAEVFERAQAVIESQTFEIRQTLLKYSNIIEHQRKIIYERRQRILNDQEELTLLKRRATDRYLQLSQTIDQNILDQVEKEINLFHIDQCWSDHLARVSEIRENIYLKALGNLSPLEEFHKIVAREFAELQESIDQLIIDTFCDSEITQTGINLYDHSFNGPASTWTYMINDNPLGGMLQRMFRGLKQGLIRKLKARKPADDTAYLSADSKH